MREWNDADLLSAYANRQSEEAFGVLVERYVALVHSAARRQVQNPHLAEEVTQAAFTILAQKARGLNQRTVLSGWLCRTAHFVARNALKTEFRRQYRETEALMQSLVNEPEDDVWQQFAPLLDEAVAQLNEADRNAVVLRFYEKKPLNEVGAILGIDSDAAQKRVSRALEKLRKSFAKRGVNSTASAIAENISAHSVQAAPVALAKTVTAVALAKGATASTSTLTLIKGALKIMAWTKVKTAVVIGAGVLLAAGTATVAIKEIKTHSTDESWRVLNLNAEIVENAAHQVRILPTKFASSGGAASYTDFKFAALDKSVDDIARIAYDVPPARVIFAAAKPQGGYDYIANFPQGSRQALQQELKKRFGLIGRPETRTVDSLLLRVRNPNAPGLKPATGGPGFLNDRVEHGQNYVTCNNLPLASIRNLLEQRLNQPVMDEIGLTQHFSFELQWNDMNGQNADHSSLKQALLDQLGLELVPTNMPVEMLVVDKVK